MEVKMQCWNAPLVHSASLPDARTEGKWRLRAHLLFACAFALLALLALTGCMIDVENLAPLVQALNDRGVSGCYEIQKQGAVGYPPAVGASGVFRGIIGTGQNTVETCVSALQGRVIPQGVYLNQGVRLKQCQGEQCTDIEVR